MYKVTWTDTTGHRNRVEGLYPDCKHLFNILVTMAKKGEAEGILLFHENGNCIDAWGT